MRPNVPFVRFIVLILTLTIFSPRSNAQSITTGDGKWEIGLGFGPMFFLGDLGGSAGVWGPFFKDLYFSFTQILKKHFSTYYPSALLGFRLALNPGTTRCKDAHAPPQNRDE